MAFDRKQYMKEYAQSEKVKAYRHSDRFKLLCKINRQVAKNKEYQKNYQQSEKYRAYKKYYRETHKEQFREYGKKHYLNHKENVAKANKKYRQSEKGKLNSAKFYAKRNRQLGFIKLFENPFDESEPIDWHHIDDTYVVALPRSLHRQYIGNEHHRKDIMEIVKQIYGGD